MVPDRVQRKMAAVLAADVVGYSRLMGVDEAATLLALKRHRQELIEPRIAEHGGRVVKLTGDGILAEFPSVVNAVACAAEIQRRMLERNRDVPNDQRMEFRVGITLGDVVVEGDDIFGDGVNVAARLEATADPGGIAISATAREHIGSRLDLSFQDMGEQTLKNIEQRIRVWKWHPAASAGSERPRTIQSKTVSDDLPSVAVLPFQNMS